MMNPIGKRSGLWMLVTLGVCLGGAQVTKAQTPAPDEFILRLEKGERRIDGVIESLDPATNSMVIDASQVSFPNGRLQTLADPLPMLVSSGEKTYFHIRGESLTQISFANAHAGDNVVVIAVYSAARQSWEAIEVALWTRQNGTQYVLDDAKPSNPFLHKPEPTPPAGLVTMWSGDYSLLDITGHYPGYAQNGTAFDRGKVGAALSFDGVNDRFSIRDSPAFALTKSLSFQGWIFIKPMAGAAVIFARTDNRVGLNPYALSIQPNGTLTFHIGSETQIANLDAPGFMPGSWIHVAATLDDATGVMRIYKNG